MSTLRVNKIYRILVIALTLFSVEANAIDLEVSHADYVQDSNCNSFTKLLHKVNIFSDDGLDPRVVQSQEGAGKMFAPIGAIATNMPVPSSDPNDIDPSTGQNAS
jgi:hypothetical protein